MKKGKILSPKKLERLRRETEKLRKERWRDAILLAVVGVLAVVLGTAAFIYERNLHRAGQEYYRHQRQKQQTASSTNKNGLKTRDTQKETTK